ncbi:alpha/beta fold hydrolase [Rufibacter ruber]|uniref:alpha/beta fold hydrolase n=1 Tax=Rufibacter ruber TaxID=1783499 RepID=UPI000834BE50|nr:alpha/beta hydrolase [Rufibacter ruber]
MAFPPLYLLSGLGADERLFQFLRLQHPNPVVVKWVTPAPHATLAQYAQQVLPQIQDRSAPAVLIGLSFGGMVAQELAKLIPTQKVILLSSLAHTPQLPWYYRAGGLLRLQKWLPFQWAKSFPAPGEWLFGAKSPLEKQVFRSIIQDTDLDFLRWSLTAILGWQHRAEASEQLVIIHGTRDKILPVPLAPRVHLVEGGEHLMVMSRAAEISALLNQHLR